MIAAIVLALLAGGLAWRFVRPLHTFAVGKRFERPVVAGPVPAVLGSLSARECGACHPDNYREWRTTLHAHAWTDPYFRADWRHEGREQICRNCHTPLDRQQPRRVLGFHGDDRWDPILAPNPRFDPVLQEQGVTCAGCHLRDGKSLGPYAADRIHAPHPVAKFADANELCVRCHVVPGARWDNFYRFPPCGTAAEIASAEGRWHGRSGEYVVGDVSALGCVQCHMPAVTRPLVPWGPARAARRHVWRGGHDPQEVRNALEIRVRAVTGGARRHEYAITLTNVGALHYVPTGVPNRYLSVDWRLLDAHGVVLRTRRRILERHVLWRPFIVDLWDTRLAYRKPRTYRFGFSMERTPRPARLEIRVRYHLAPAAYARRVGYRPQVPLAYSLYHRAIRLAPQAASGANASGPGARIRTPSNAGSAGSGRVPRPVPVPLLRSPSTATPSPAPR